VTVQRRSRKRRRWVDAPSIPSAERWPTGATVQTATPAKLLAGTKLLRATKLTAGGMVG
jgi:hypothetical protein